MTAGPALVASPRRFPTELVRFAAVRLVAYAVDVALFNVLLVGAGAGAVLAKSVSGLAAISVAFVGNARWVFPGRGSGTLARQYAMFALLSVVAVLLQVGCVWAAHLLGHRGTLADNLAGNVLGMALATAFRFWAFRTWVFAPTPARPDQRQEELP